MEKLEKRYTEQDLQNLIKWYHDGLFLLPLKPRQVEGIVNLWISNELVKNLPKP